MVALEVICNYIYIYSKEWLRELEKEYEAMTWLYCVVEMIEYCIGSYILCCLPKLTEYMECSTFCVLGLLGRVIKN